MTATMKEPETGVERRVIDGYPECTVDENGVVYSIKGKPLTTQPQYVNGWLVPVVYLRRPGEGQVRFQLAHVVARTFLNAPPNPTWEVLPKDGDLFNVRASNLQWVPPSEFYARMGKPEHKLVTRELRDAILADRQRGASQNEIATKYRISAGDVSTVLHTVGLSERQVANVAKGRWLPQEERDEDARRMIEVLRREGRTAVTYHLDRAQRIEISDHAVRIYFNGAARSAVDKLNGAYARTLIAAAVREVYGLAHDESIEVEAIALHPKAKPEPEPEVVKTLRRNGRYQTDEEYAAWKAEQKTHENIVRTAYPDLAPLVAPDYQPLAEEVEKAHAALVENLGKLKGTPPLPLFEKRAFEEVAARSFAVPISEAAPTSQLAELLDRLGRAVTVSPSKTAGRFIYQWANEGRQSVFCGTHEELMDWLDMQDGSDGR